MARLDNTEMDRLAADHVAAQVAVTQQKDKLVVVKIIVFC